MLLGLAAAGLGGCGVGVVVDEEPTLVRLGAAAAKLITTLLRPYH